MRFTKIIKSVGKSTTFEMFDENSGNFILSLATNNSLYGPMIITTLQGLEAKPFQQILLLHGDSMCASYIGRSTPNFTGYYRTVALNNAVLATMR